MKFSGKLKNTIDLKKFSNVIRVAAPLNLLTFNTTFYKTQDVNQKKLAKLIKRQKSGSISPEEAAELEKIWNDVSQDKSFLEDHTPTELEETERNIFKAIKFEIAQRGRSRYAQGWNNTGFYKAAAAVLILVSVSLWWFTRSNGLTEIQTSFGERLTVTLPDKSTVVLNGNSVLRYASDWNKNAAREVWIEGEGFFSIIHTSNHQKFIVHASNQLDVEVLGTKFNVKARNNASEVMLTEGKVKLGLAKNEDVQEVFLKPGELATLHNKQFSKRSVKQQQYTSWVENKLFFERTALSEVALLLKETYGLNVTFTHPSLKKREISGEISSATEDDVLYAIAETFDLQVDKRGTSVTISLKTIDTTEQK